MKKPQINPAVIGVFIAGAIVIFFTSIIVFGSGRLFTKTKEMLLTFREPVAGLDAGAPVKLLGVTVGSVKEIYLQPAKDPTQGILINVIIEIDRKKAQSMFREYRLDFNSRARFERMINERGLRGQLDVLSLVSGQLYIALNLSPGEKASSSIGRMRLVFGKSRRFQARSARCFNLWPRLLAAWRNSTSRESRTN